MEILKSLCQLHHDNNKTLAEELQEIVTSLSELRNDLADMAGKLRENDEGSCHKEKKLNDEFLKGLVKTSN